MLQLKNISVQFGKKTILKNISVAFKEDAIYGLVGINGAGKTTFFKALFGIVKTSEGVIHLNEKPIDRNEIAYLETENYFYPNITGREYLNLFSVTTTDFDNWNQLLKLPLDDLIETYSTGMKKKLAIWAVIKLNRPILLLDEPFNGLDLETTELLKKILVNLKQQNKIIILTAHVFSILEDCCDEIAYLEGSGLSALIRRTDFGAFYKKIVAKLDETQDQLLRQIF